jgi:hypothetical protein
MKLCLDDNELLRLWTAEAGEFPDQRAHLAQCSGCAASYDQLTRETCTITAALTAAADHLRPRESAAVRTFHVRVGESFRIAAIFTGAVAFGGASAFALLIALGWQPAGASNRFAHSPVNAAIAQTTAGTRTRPAGTVIAANEPSASSMVNGSLYTVDAIESDPVEGLTYGDSVQGGNLNPSSEDLLFCVPGDDGAICSSSDGQG